MRRTIMLLAAMAGAVPGAIAQFTSDSVVVYTLSWRESDAFGGPGGNGNGLVEPGEHALLQLAVSFTNQNTIGSFSPAIGSFTSGTIRGFGAAFLDLHGAGGAQGAWNVDCNFGLGVDPTWDLIGCIGAGTPAAGGTQLLNLQMGQFPASGAAINPTNPVVAVWRGVWTPAVFSGRDVEFTLVPAVVSGGLHSALMIRIGTPPPVGVFCDAVFGSARIGVGPACYPNCDGSATLPVLTVADFGCFINAFAAGSAYANCDASTTPPVLTVADYGCFLNRFAAGCM
jgi:hypothetical protein